MGPYRMYITSYIMDYQYANGIVAEYNLIVDVGLATRLNKPFSGENIVYRLRRKSSSSIVKWVNLSMVECTWFVFCH